MDRIRDAVAHRKEVFKSTNPLREESERLFALADSLECKLNVLDRERADTAERKAEITAGIQAYIDDASKCREEAGALITQANALVMEAYNLVKAAAFDVYEFAPQIECHGSGAMTIHGIRYEV